MLMEQLVLEPQENAELQNLELPEQPKSEAIPEEPKKVATFAARALLDLAGPVRDTRTILLSERAKIQEKRSELQRQLKDLNSLDEDKELKVMELDVFLAECDKLAALSPSVEPYIKVNPPGFNTKPNPIHKSRGIQPEPEFGAAECLKLFEAAPMEKLNAGEIRSRIDPERNVTMGDIANRLMYLANQGKITRVMQGVYQLTAKNEERQAAAIAEASHQEVAIPHIHALEPPAEEVRRPRGRPRNDAPARFVLPHLAQKHPTALSSPPPAPQVHAAGK